MHPAAALLALAGAALALALPAAAGTVNGHEVLVRPPNSMRENAMGTAHVDQAVLDAAARRRLARRGNNAAANYKYSLQTDCYGAFVPTPGESTFEANSADPFLQPFKPYKCPEGTFCLVDVRDNWRPFSSNFMNRGRCQAYSQEGDSCTSPYTGPAFHPIQADGTYFKRGTYCDPAGLECTGDTVAVLPPTCVQRRPKGVCYTNSIQGWSRTGFDPANVANLPGSDMWCPSSAGRAPNRTEIEFAARYFLSQNGENAVANNQSQMEMVPVPAGAGIVNFYGGAQAGNWRVGNELLLEVWPWPVCFKADGSCPAPGGKCVKTDCTSFPLGALPAPFLAGTMNYIYLWALFHTLVHNAPDLPTPRQLRAVDGLAFLLKQTHACVFCRWNFGELVDIYGPPSRGSEPGNAGTREGLAKWFWRAHNNANEHARITHRTSDALACAPDDEFCVGWDVCQNAGNPEGLMCNAAGKATVFENPSYTSPWFLAWEDAEDIWRFK
ncbi:hypothetical protein DFJ74DRAFT_677748 [Hyaloraphidium curvatum]|nr:hypothetical protein DFJ74DRAFT_677748 [Hyaloraphidium curvatum]